MTDTEAPRLLHPCTGHAGSQTDVGGWICHPRCLHLWWGRAVRDRRWPRGNQRKLRARRQWKDRNALDTGGGGVDYRELVRRHAEWMAGSAVREEWRWQEMLERNLSHGMDWEQAREAVQQKKDRESGMSPVQLIEAKWQRKDAREREERYLNLAEFCAGEVAAALAELGPDAVDLAEIRDDLKAYAFPVADEVAAEVDGWFDSQACAVLVEAARNPKLELVPVPEPKSVRVPPEPPPGAGPGVWVWED